MRNKPKLLKLIGEKIKAIKGYAYKRDLFGKLKKTYIEPQYILFDDGETFIELENQDYHSCHDADEYAKLIKVIADKERWNKIMKDKNYVNITYDGDIDVGSL